MKAIKTTLIVLIIVIVLAALYFVYGLYINPKSPLGRAEFKSELNEISVRYYRPYSNNRLIFGEAADSALVPNGMYWRLGANLTTKITTKQEITFAGSKLAAGSYGLYAYPSVENWVLYVHAKSGGFSATEPDPSGIVMKVNLPVQTLSDMVEQLTLDFVESGLRMRWSNIQVVIPID